MASRTTLVIGALILALAAPSHGAADALVVSRVGGLDRYATAVDTALAALDDTCRRLHSDPDEVDRCNAQDLGSWTLVRGDSFADALSAASIRLGSILLGQRDVLPPALDRLRGRFEFQATIIGEDDVISDAVADEIVPDFGQSVARVGGPTRIDTAVAVARMHQDVYGDSSFAFRRIAIVNAESWPDALTAGALSEALSIVLPVYHDTIPTAVATLLEEETGADTTITVIGGDAAISDEVVRQLHTLTPAAVQRVGGADRFETARLVADHYLSEGPQILDEDGERVLGVLLIRPDDFADAIPAPNLMRSRGAPILIAAATDELGAANAEWLHTNGPRLSTITALGTADVLTDDVLEQAHTAACTDRSDC